MIKWHNFSNTLRDVDIICIWFINSAYNKHVELRSACLMEPHPFSVEGFMETIMLQFTYNIKMLMT